MTRPGNLWMAHADYMIDPDSGSVNLFRTGAPRTTPEAQRKYSVEVRLAEKPTELPLVQSAGQPPRNYLYSLPSKNPWLDKSGQPVERSSTGFMSLTGAWITRGANPFRASS